MKLSELKQLVALLEDNAEGKDTEVRFSDYSQRAFPVLDLDRPVSKIVYAQHVSGNGTGIVYLPLDTASDKKPY